MTTSRIFVLAALSLVAAAVVPGSTGNVSRCGIAPAHDPIVAELDRTQSAGAAKICAIYLNTLEALPAR
jgi:hypothetical protein